MLFLAHSCLLLELARPLARSLKLSRSLSSSFSSCALTVCCAELLTAIAQLEEELLVIGKACDRMTQELQIDEQVCMQRFAAWIDAC